MQGSRIVPAEANVGIILEFDKNPSLQAMKTIQTIQPQSSSVEFIGQGENLQGIYLRSMHDIRTHIPHLYYLLVQTREGRPKVLDVLNKLKEFSDGGETLNPIELLMLQKLTQMNQQR